MNNPLKIAVLGGGSTYTPELVNGFLDLIEEFPLDELWLMDIDPGRLEIVGGLARRMVEARGAPFRVVLTTDRQNAVRDADYVTTQLRVGQMAARRKDEYLGRRHGLIGQETTGIGGMAKALRTIPVLLDAAEDVRTLAKPGALLVNFTNPAGLVTEALARYAPEVPTVGVCNIPINTKMDIIEKLGAARGEAIPPERAELDTLGLNHLTWHRGFRVDGEDLWPVVLQGFVDELRESDEPEWDTRTIEVLRMIPNYYLHYFYETEKMLAEQRAWPPSRAETVMEIEKELLEQYADPALKSAPEGLMARGGAYYSTVATRLLHAHYNDLHETHVVNTRSGGAVPGWPSDWVLEMPAEVSASGIRPLPTEPLPPVCFGLISAVKSYEILTVEAAVHGDRNAAYQALLAHPLGPSAGNAQAVLEDMLETHRDHLPQFRKE